ncbi:kinase-like domain-containing protein [Nemania sp. FL0031]|nr:kinase-like domain-containing protein [Nemania sp. FL0031]
MDTLKKKFAFKFRPKVHVHQTAQSPEPNDEGRISNETKQQGLTPNSHGHHTASLLGHEGIQDMSSESFKAHLENYSQYISRAYEKLDIQRSNISSRLGHLDKRRPFCLEMYEVLEMDRWMRKRGPPMLIADHELNTALIMENSNKEVREYTRRAFAEYKTLPIDGDVDGDADFEVTWEAMSILERLRGIDRGRANLLLSAAYPNTIPYYSEAMFQWLIGKDFKSEQQKDDYRKVFFKVRDIMAGFNTAAVDIEKVAHVLERKGKIEGLKNKSLTHELVSGQRCIGSGQYGSVFKVQLNRDTAAVKQIALTGQMGKAWLHVLNEVVLSKQLSAKYPEHFIKFLGWNNELSTLHMAMENAEYGDLEQSLGNKKITWTQEGIKSVSTQILEGLECMHGMSIAHRDLKPKNVLVTSVRDGVIKVKIADFGVSKKLSVTDTSRLVTAVGTPEYGAPEIYKARGKKSYDGYSYKVDIWSLGCIIYRMASGDHLFTGEGGATDKTDRWIRKEIGKLKEMPQPAIRISKSGIRLIQKLIVVKVDRRADAGEALLEIRDWVIS